MIMSILLGLLTLSSVKAHEQDDIVDFESERWILRNAEIVEHMGRKSLMGLAYLEDVEFENGIIEVDICADGSRSYPGVIFRMQSEENYERLYLRPHRSNLYPDAIQYTPAFNGVDGWQLYNGEGFTAGADILANQWLHLRIDIQGEQARVYLGASDIPDLVIGHLQHGVSKGGVGVFCPRDRTAFFSNFKYRIDNSLHFDPAPEIETPPGIITEWYLSQSFKIGEIDRENYPDEQELGEIEWQKVKSDRSGLVDIARYVKRIGREPDCILARSIIHSEKEEAKKLIFGYSDAIHVFLSGRFLFSGSSAYRERDPSFLGIVGLHDAIYLPLKEGENELLLIVTESFGGWGFICGDGNAIFLDKDMKKQWMTSSEFLIPESVAYDPSENVLYVSNLDIYNRSTGDEKQFISKISVDGVVEELRWVTGLNNPTGVATYQDRLFVVERRSLVEIDMKSARILSRVSIPASVFLNDVVIDSNGNAYVSDSATDVVYKVLNGNAEEWLKGGGIARPNGLDIHENKLIVGNNGDNRLKSVDLTSKEVATIGTLGAGIIDGVKSDKDGNYLVSQWEGKLYRVDASGKVKKLLDTTIPGLNSADFEYIVEKNMIVIPTFMDNKVTAYKLAD
jgi:DNA-binding beta-propeller fold protein YncE